MVRSRSLGDRSSIQGGFTELRNSGIVTGIEMNHWQPDFPRTELVVTAVPAGHAIFPCRILEWWDFLDELGYLPAVLLTKEGWMVNGHHRLIVARDQKCRLHGHIVERVGPAWMATGNLCLVK